MTNFEAQARELINSLLPDTFGKCFCISASYTYRPKCLYCVKQDIIPTVAKALSSTAKEATRVERERCAKIAESHIHCFDGFNDCYCQIEIASAIRNSQ